MRHQAIWLLFPLPVQIPDVGSYREGEFTSILCEQELVKELDWSRRVVVVRNVARALPYLHHDCDDPIVHCDIKSSNILLDHKEYMKLHS